MLPREAVECTFPILAESHSVHHSGNCSSRAENVDNGSTGTRQHVLASRQYIVAIMPSEEGTYNLCYPACSVFMFQWTGWVTCAPGIQPIKFIGVCHLCAFFPNPKKFPFECLQCYSASIYIPSKKA